ncbi:MAG: hypothetical protein KGL74_14730 [Elusimicrobia bacterium]|nr:hypothetical protein [Elusimicrobiota bacterium]
MTRTKRFWLEWLGAFALCAAICAAFQYQTPFLGEEDSYYHIRFAWLLRHHGFFRAGFHWARFSLWRDGFSDGSIVFHLILMPFTFGDLMAGGKAATLLLSAFTFSSFFAVLTLNNVRGRLYWFWVFLLGGGFYWWRMMVLRPQILSAALLLWSVHFLLKGNKKAFGALSFLYPLSYVAAFLPQVFSVVRWAYLKLVERRDERLLVLTGLGAYALATLLHPYFPKNLRFFYVQNFYVMYLAMTRKVNLYLAGEFLPLDTRQLVGAHAVLIANLVAVFFVQLHRRKPLSERTRLMFPIALIVVLLTCGSKRFVEYSVPMTTLFCAFLSEDVFAGYDEAAFTRDYGRPGLALACAWLMALGAATGAEAFAVSGDFKNVRPPRFRELAATLAEKAPPGELIYTCDWDEPPELLFYNPQHDYPVLMDPTFMYYWNPAIWQTWFDTANARLPADEVVDALTNTFHARFGLCSSKFAALRRLIGADKRFTILAENQNGYVFQLRNDGH